MLYRLTGTKPLPLVNIAVSPKGNRIACGTSDARIVLINSKTGKSLRFLTGHQSMISALVFTHGGSSIISSSWDSTTRSWSSTKGTQNETPLSHTTEIKSLAVHGETSRGAVGTRDGLVKVFTLPSLKCIRNVPAHNRDVSGLAFTSDGSRLISSSWDGWVKIWDLSSYEIIKNVMRQKERIRSTVLSPDDSRVYLGLHNGVIRSVSLDNARDVEELKGHGDIVSALTINPNGNLLASGSWDRTLRVWDIRDNSSISVVKTGTGISSLAWNPSNDVLYSTDFSGSLIAWNLN